MIGTIIQGYQILSEINRGGMGRVYLAKHIRLEKMFAIKALDSHLAEDDNFVSRFVKEAQRQIELKHPNIVSLHTLIEHEGSLLLVMEYVDGPSLATLMKENGALKPSEALAITSGILVGLGHAHAAGLVHRDIKPSNIMLSRNGVAKVMDFGIALAQEGTRYTRTGTALGTPHYMSPEQIQEPDRVDQRSDIYSVGVLLFEMLTGRTPFLADTDGAIYIKQVQETPPDIRSISPAVPSGVAKLVERALKKKQEERFATCDDFIRAIRKIEEQELGITLCPHCQQRNVIDPGVTLLVLCKGCGRKLEAEAVPQPHPPTRVVEIKRHSTADAEAELARLKPKPGQLHWMFAAVTLILVVSAVFGWQKYNRDRDLKAGIEAYDKKDYEKARKFLLPLAEKGVARAMQPVGWMYKEGKGGFAKDEAEALKWYRKGAEAGDGRAMNGMGNRYNYGELGLAKDKSEAVKWYRKGAEAGDGEAMWRLGVMYLNGMGGLARDEVEGVKWVRKGAEAGDDGAMWRLGVMYLNGMGGLARDEVEGVKWVRKGAEAGDGGAMWRLGVMYLNGTGGLARDEVEGVKWYRKGAEAGDGEAMWRLGFMYVNGKGGLARDEVEGVKWYRKGAEAGDGEAMVNLGIMYENGQSGLKKDEAEAVKWYRKGAEAGEGRAMACLGITYQYGKGGLARDETEAVKWYRKGAEAGDGWAMLRLGLMYANGKGGLSKDEVEEVIWYRKGAEAGDGGAMNNLGVMYENGQGGLKADRNEAIKWYKKALEAGSEDAKVNLNRLGVK